MADRVRDWSLALRLAARELRGGLAGFRIFLACLMLGVAAIGGVGSLAASVGAGIAADARDVLGGDIELRLLYRPASDEQRAFFARFGAVSEARELRAMARAAADDAGRRLLVELKTVDGAYPLYGATALDPPLPLAAALERRDGVWGAVADRALLERLGLRPGDRLRVGDLDYRIAAVLQREPDRGAGLFSLGPRLMAASDSLAATGLIQPGSLITYDYRLRLPAGGDPDAFAAAVRQAWPSAGWRIRGLDEAAPGLKRFVDRTALFLTLVGLATLLVGGIGVANAVRAYLAGKAATIATLKCLGAPGGLVLQTYLMLVMLLAAGGVVAGLVVAALTPPGLSALLERSLGVHARFGL